MTAVEGMPLFPLGTVLFPGALLPLHVFEARYRQLVRDVLAAPLESRAFGVVAIREGREVGTDGIQALHPVGCVARLRRVEPYDDGRFDIVTSGATRFRLTGLDTGLPYLRGDIELLGEPDGPNAEVAAARVAMAYDDYRGALGAVGLDSGDGLPSEPAALSYLVAGGVVLDLTEKQRLLEEPDSASRLRTELGLLRRETALLSMLPSLPAVELTRIPQSPN